jgi:hypothetical protein
MVAIAKLERRLARVGASIDPDRDRVLSLDAPPGYVWRASGGPCYQIPFSVRGQSWLSAALREAEPALALGLLRVSDPDELQRLRFELGDPGWAAADDAPDKLSV